jgi:hypothetical protein
MKYFLILLLLFISCGTRKSETNKTNVKDDRITIENTYSTGEKIILSDVFTLSPFDGLKPMLIDGRSYTNVVVKHDKSKVKEKYFNITKKIFITKTITLLKNKETKKTDNTILYIGLFFVFCLFVFLWFYFKTDNILFLV